VQPDVVSILIGGVISLASAVVVLLLQDHLQARRQRRQWEREDALRREAELRGNSSEIRALQWELESGSLEGAKKLGYFLAEKGGAGIEEFRKCRPSRAVAWGPLAIVVLFVVVLAVVIYFALLPLLRLLVTLPAWILALVVVILVNIAAIVVLRLGLRRRKGQWIVARLIELHPSWGEYLYTRRGHPVVGNRR